MSKVLKAEVDWSAVEQEILCHNLPRWDVADMQNMVASAALKYLDEDLERGVHSVETPFLKPRAGWDKPIKGTPDLCLGARGEYIADWKTTGKIDQEWIARMNSSWQWRIYLWATGADAFSYRGIQRDGYTRQVTFERYEGLNDSVENYVTGIQNIRSALKDLVVYPMKRPYACRAYGRPCRYMDDCSADGRMRQLVDPASLEYTTMEYLLLCPERYRRNEVFGRDAEGSEDTAFGTVFHKAIACVYQQFLVKVLDKSHNECYAEK